MTTGGYENKSVDNFMKMGRQRRHEGRHEKRLK
jgi:hypothetical protein